MTNTLPWSGRDLYLFLADNGTVLDLRAARDNDKLNGVFKVGEVADLFASAQESGFGLKSQNVVLFGAEKHDDGRAKAIMAEHKQPYQKDGKTLQGSYAYSSKQLKAFAPMGFVVKTKFIKTKKGANIPIPLLLVFATAMTQQNDEAVSFVRVKAGEQTPQAETVTRRSARA
jgi:hypothetical protein